MTPKEIRLKMEELHAKAFAKLDELSDDTPEPRRDEIQREFDRILVDHDNAAKMLEQVERQERAEAALREAEERELAQRRPHGGDLVHPAAGGGDGMGYREAFIQYLLARGQEGAMPPEAREALRQGYTSAVEGGSPDRRIQVTTSNAAGGYTVPEEMMNRIVIAMAAWGPMYDPGVTEEIMTADGINLPFPTVDDTASTAEPHTEGTPLTDDGGKDAVFGTRMLGAYAYNTEWLKISYELMSDSLFNVEGIIGRLLGERLGRIANEKLTIGTGTGEPQGLVPAVSAGHVAASTSAITFDELIELEHSIDPAYRDAPNKVYMMHDETFKAIRQLKDGQGNYLWQGGDVTRGAPPTLNASPFRINQAMPKLSDGVDSKVITFGVMDRYTVRKVGRPFIVAMQDRVDWPNIGMAGYIRFDGVLSDTRAIKALALAAS